MNEEEKTLKEELKKNKKIIIAFVVGGIVGSIIAKRDMKTAVQMARADGYNKGTGDILKALLSDNK